MVHLSEGRPVGGLPVPALSHESVDPGWTARRTLHPVATLQQLGVRGENNVNFYCHDKSIENDLIGALKKS